MFAIITDIIKDYHRHMVPKIQHHFQGGSIISPIDWNVTRKTNFKFKKQSRHIDLAILETVHAGAAWPIDRIQQKYEVGNICPKCKQETHSVWHECWTCPHIQTIESEHIEKSNHLIHKDMVIPM